MVAEGKIRDEALADKELLAQVVMHKKTFCPSGWARYNAARPGSLRLVPPENRLNALQEDYKKMGMMILGKQPPLEAAHDAGKRHAFVDRV